MNNKLKSILFISPKVRNNEKSPPHFPLGIAYLAAYLKSKRVKVAAVDLNIDDNEDKLITKAKGFDFVGISVFATAQINHGYYLAQKIKTTLPKIKIVYGGYHTNVLPEEAFRVGYADYVIKGHGEIPLYMLLKGESLDTIPGLVYFKDGKFISNPDNQRIDLDSLPFPAVHLFKIKKYQDDVHVLPYARHTAIDVKTSMGCPNFCTYCSAPLVYKGKVYFKSPSYVAEELKYYIKRFGIKYFHFEDENWLVDRDRIIQICNRIISERIEIKYAFMSSINIMYKNLDLLPLLKKSGCVCIDLGLETASNEVQKKINKSNNLEQLLVVDKILKKHDIYPFILIMTFNIGETLNSVAETTKFMLRLAPTEIQTVEYLRTNSSPYGFGQFATPHVGTQFYKEVSSSGLFLSDNNYDLHTWTKPSFIPYSFLNDVPSVRKKCDKNKFIKYINQYRVEIQRYFNKYEDLFWNVYSRVDSAETILGLYQKNFNKYDLSQISLAFAMLAKLNLICSRHSKN
ncbi:hypothetical protein COX03_01185 [Candidatus Woesebacteria bacterium CG22_combo_CG10-13_8_21_14_all_39_10]|uniref:Uncharacterized protein n=2 Tax=Candidatus Woeseibacteriota TaxID=1752722 RepID=A0A2H0BJC0_9BACT|nr:MAG: hypothetical protein COX03_01185 [Candidatus Woesebacteria bacterium CG22_combo_CG10-13_8_21_14_all_39_10]PIZ50318.1 MAG: hypothetical protein COY29_00080 [Candidatus Woesebacteria bacterium CG_4_10_14_0_2_um_filter_39_14]